MADDVKARSGIGKPKIVSEQPASVDFKSSKLLFAFLVVGVAVALLAGSRAMPKKDPAPNPAHSDTFGILAAMLPWLLIVAFIYYFFLRRLRPVDVRANNDALSMIYAGHLDEAAEMLDGLLKRCTAKVPVRAAALFNRGYVYLLKGEHELALTMFDDAQLVGGKTAMQEDISVYCLSFSALALALLNRTSAANDRLDSIKEVLPFRTGRHLPARVAILLRCGDFAGAEQKLEDDWRLGEAVLLSTDMKMLRILRAFALSRLESTPERRAALTDLIAGLYPYEPGEFDYLAVEWPELKTFMIEQKLSAAQ